MNNKIIIGVVVVLLVIGGGWYLISSKGTAPGSMNELLASKDSLECAYSQANDQADTTGTLYVSGGKVRGDFAIKTKAEPVKTFESHLITDGKQVLLWPLTPETPNQGITVAVDPTNKEQVNLDQPIEASCKSWVVDESKFTAPSGVQFADAAALQQAFQAQAEQQAAAQSQTETKPASTTPAE